MVGFSITLPIITTPSMKNILLFVPPTTVNNPPQPDMTKAKLFTTPSMPYQVFSTIDTTNGFKVPQF